MGILYRTQVGTKVVSTIKREEELKQLDDVLSFADDLLDRPAKLGASGDFETMVFNCDEDGEISDWTELDFARYDSEEDAQIGHNELVTKYGK